MCECSADERAMQSNLHKCAICAAFDAALVSIHVWTAAADLDR
jgi:hypothetical protein